MIKLIAVDMDGTFLNDKKEKSPEYKNVIKKLREQDVFFCVASGRQLASIKKEFEEINEGIIFVAENGAVIEMNNEIIAVEELDESLLDAILEKEKVLNKKMICCAKNYTYLKMEDEHDAKNAQTYLPNHKVVTDFYNLPEKPVKVSFFSLNGHDEDFDLLMKEFSDIAAVFTSVYEWIDIMSKDVHKGAALKKVQAKLNISNKETMPFGDQMNDYHMLKEAFHSYAMENANVNIKNICRHIAPSNNEFGVIQVLKEQFNIK